MRRPFLLLLLLFLYLPLLNAQSQADRDLIEQARSLYKSSTPPPAYIACDASIDWDAVVKRAGVPPGQVLDQGLDLLRTIKISFVTRGDARTEVTVTGDEKTSVQKEKIKGQIIGFFHAYWTMPGEHLLPSPHATYKLAATPEGYTITNTLKNGAISTVQMDKSFLISVARAAGSTSDLTLAPRFEREDDGTLHLRGVLIDFESGQTRLVTDYSFDYQQAGTFYIPHHVKMTNPGALSFSHTFSNCQALDSNQAPPPATTEHSDSK